MRSQQTAFAQIIVAFHDRGCAGRGVGGNEFLPCQAVKSREVVKIRANRKGDQVLQHPIDKGLNQYLFVIGIGLQ